MVGRKGHRLVLRDSDWSERRVAADMSLRDLEAATGIHRTILSMLERGRYLPTPDEVERIIEAFNRKASATIESSATAGE